MNKSLDLTSLLKRYFLRINMNLDNFLGRMYEESCWLQSQGRQSENIYTLEQYSVQSLNTLGLAYCATGVYFDKAIECFKDALKIDTGNWILWSNICHAYSLMEDHENSLEAAMNAIETSRGVSFDPFYNAGVALTSLNKIPEAIAMYEIALELKQNHCHANYNYGLCKLRMNLCQDGWEKYENRFITNPLTGKFKQRFLAPDWDGRKLKGKKLLVYSEQGLGDFIFYGRFIPLLKDFGATVAVEVQEQLVPILGENFKIDEIISRKNDRNWPEPIESDYVVSVASLPRIFKVDSKEKIPKDPYVFASNKPKPDFYLDEKLKIGLCWCGNSDHQRDHTRSMFVEQFNPLTEIPNTQFFGLVKGVNKSRKWPTGVVNLFKGIENFPMINLESQIKDFGDLMHYINHLDLVITVDTGLAHLAGAMGKKTWVLLGSEVDWRWGYNKETTPWYPSVRLFNKKDTWENLVQEFHQ